MPRKVKEELIHIQTIRDNRCVDMFLTLSEIEKGVDRFLDPKNESIRPNTCCTCWPIEKPPKCSFWDRIMFRCESCKE